MTSSELALVKTPVPGRSDEVGALQSQNPRNHEIAKLSL